MKIGINTLFLIPGEVGGSQTYLVETLRAMIQLYPRLHLVFFTNIENHDYLKEHFVSFRNVEWVMLKFRAKNRFVRILCEQFRLPFKTIKNHIDLLWSPGYTAPMWAGCPQAVSILDLQYKRHPEDFTLPARIATDAMIRLAMQSCRIILTISEFSKSEILHHTSFPASRIVVTPLAAADAFAERISKGELKKRLKSLIPGVSHYILTVSNSYPHKNLDTLVEAFGMLERSIPHHLVIVGKPRLGEKRLRIAIDKLSDSRRFIRLQAVAQQDLVALYQGADLFAFPSLYEGFGLPVLEAMKAGVPVVAASMGAIPEVGGGCVHYANPATCRAFAEKIYKVIKADKSERLRWIAAAKARAQHFSWQRTADDTLRAFCRTLPPAV